MWLVALHRRKKENDFVGRDLEKVAKLLRDKGNEWRIRSLFDLKYGFLLWRHVRVHNEVSSDTHLAVDDGECLERGGAKLERCNHF